MRNSVSISENRKDCVVCPKPRRLGLLNHSINDPIRTLRWQLSHQTEQNDVKAGNDLIELMLIHGDRDQSSRSAVATQVASSPPFFCGSPPSRASNPLIQDARFGEEKPKLPTPLSPLSITSPRKGGSYVRAKFGHTPAPVRIEGFNCLDRDRRSVSAVA